jgi:thymidylate synthase (FAD)
MQAEYISHMGDDLTVVNAARVSFSKESAEVSLGDAKLIKYLAEHGHWTPFSHPQVTLRYTVPIFIARQEFKHIVGFTRNEVSRRYVDDTPTIYEPKEWRGRPEGSIKQGSTGKHKDTTAMQVLYDYAVGESLDSYRLLIELGAAPEQARMVLPQSMYTSYYITGSLAAFARMVKQRSDPHAQVEIQELAKMVAEVIEPLYPVSWEALVHEQNNKET